jgi:hypothetical protein
MKIQKISKLVITTALSVLAVSGLSYAAGSLTAPSGSPSAQSYTLSDIYNKLTSGVDAVSGGHYLSTTTLPAGSFRTLTEIYNAIPGTLSLANSTTTVPVGINTSTTSLSTIDTDLVASKIASSTVIFGVTGTLYGDTDPSKVLNTATYPGTAAPGYTYPSATLKTNVTVCHNSGGSVISCAGTGQEGQYQTGYSFSYTDNGNGTVTDNRTGLMWNKCPNGLSGSTCATGTATTTSFYNAITECENSTTAGYTDWRLPNIKELYTLVDLTSAPSLASTTFPANTTSAYWTSSYNTSGNPFIGITLDFSYGRVTDQTKSNTYRSRCVRNY